MKILVITLLVALAINTKADENGVLDKGWMHQVKVDAGNMDANNADFSMNPEFMKQQKQIDPKTANASDEVGAINVPDIKSFFFVVTRHSINILTSRRNDIGNTQDVIFQTDLKKLQGPTVKDGKELQTGGVMRIGEFTEGWCFKLSLNKGSQQVLCTKNGLVQNRIVDVVTKLKLLEDGLVSDDFMQGMSTGGKMNVGAGGAGGSSSGGSAGGAGGADGSGSSSEYSMETPSSDSLLAGGAAKRNGKWIIAGDWTPCNMPCGGGQQTRERFCVPAAGGGKPCVGSSILTRICNSQPCAGGAGGSGGGAGGAGGAGGGMGGKVAVHNLATKTLPMSIQMKQISNRPQRYEECVVREGDICVLRDDLSGFPLPPRLPARSVLNLDTFSVQENSNFDSIQMAQNLHELVVLQYEKDPDRCFIVMDQMKKHKLTLCACDFSSASPMNVKASWLSDIAHFRDDCTKPVNPKSLISPDKLANLEEEELEARADAMDDNKVKKVEAGMDMSVHETAKLAAEAIQKELKAEEMEEKEELERERQELSNMGDQMKMESEKERCIKKALKKKSRQQEKKAKALEVAEKIQRIKEQTREEVLKNRAANKKRMDILRRQQQRKKMSMQKEMSMLKMEMTAQMLKAEVEGDMTNCGPNKDAQHREAFCNRIYGDDWVQNKSCRDKDNFCQMCCETEFGDLHMDARDLCYSKCDETNDSGGGGAAPGKEGLWVFIPHAKEKK